MIKQWGLYIAWVVALIATLGSLYFSEIQGFVPCTLCWYQRIMMYPLVIWLGIASYRNDKRIIPYVLPVSILGALTAAWHYLQQKVDLFSGIEMCREGVPCNESYVDWLGFITIPFLSLVAFVLITIFLILSRTKAEK